MKVLITTDWYKPVINGVVTSVVNLAENLEKQGAEVRILTLSGNIHSRIEGNVTYIGSIGVGKIYPDARMKMRPYNKYIRELIDWRPDIVHSQCEFSTFFLAKKISDECGCPLVHTYHTVYEDFTHYFSPNIRFGRLMAAVFSRKILSKTDSVIAPTGKVYDLLRRYKVRTPITVIPTGLDLRKFDELPTYGEREELRASLGIGRDEKVLVNLGRMAQEKNIEEIMEFLARENNGSVRLLLVGDGPYRPELESKASVLGIKDRVIFTGMVKPEEVARYYNAGDIFVSASQSETQGLTYIEAMAAGLPLLCRDDPCLADVIRMGENGFTYDDRSGFSGKLNMLLGDDQLRGRLSKAARETAYTKFSAEGFAKSVLEEYERMLGLIIQIAA